ncbi:Spermidine/putrescine import ABC transporter substrate-binding protein PotD (TC 3.A.1.11.1) [Azospirillum palustre]
MTTRRAGRLCVPMMFAMLIASGSSHARDLTVVGFGGSLQDAMRTAYFEPFAKRSGAPLIEESYTGGIAKLKAMNQSRTVTWDVLQMDENEMTLACDEGLLEPFDWKSQPGAADILPQVKASCGVGAFVWSKVLAFDPAKTPGVTSWADFWDLKRWPGERGLRKQARMTLEIALLADGVAPDKLYETLGTKAGVDRAFAKLDQIKPHIRWWVSGAQPVEWLAAGNVVMTSAYNGRVAAANKDGRNFTMLWTQQLYSADYWTIPKGTDKLAAARELVAYMTSPDAQKRFAETIPYGVTNNRASALIDPKIQSDLPTAPQNMARALMIDTPFWVNNEDELQQRFERWVAQ